MGYILKVSNANGESGLNRYISMLAGNTATNPFTATGSYDALATYTVPSGGVSSITFAGLPTGGQYTHLQIRALLGSGNASNSALMRFNSDTTNANYRDHELYGNGSAAYASTNGNYAYIGMQGGGITTSPAAWVIDILDYPNTNKYKVVRSLAGYDANGSGYVYYSSLLWMNTNAINTIDIVSSGSNFVQYSQFSLYGVKG
jgi:hypothetical protein